ncbi:MAG TPA: hypothetical protein VE866_03155 [Candidatus Binatia bacterium]|nr:hypothetical protein [Candidatus Binatia bacterium]
MTKGSQSSSGSEASGGPVRWLLPSIADLIFLALLGVLILTPLSVRLLGDAGIGWHIRTGQEILASHAVPRIDSFSSTMNGKPWLAWEWLYDVKVGWLDSAFGLNGVVWFTALAIAAVFSGMFQFLIRRGTHLFCALGLVLLAISASMIHFLARPHVLSWLFVLFWFWILHSAERNCEPVSGGRNRWLWLLPVSMLIWVNIHGGFLLGFVLIGIFWLGSLWTRLRSSDSRLEDSLAKIAAGKQVRALTSIGLLSVLASFVNPYGWRLHAHVFSYLSNRFLIDHIDEFQSPNFHGIAQKCFLALLLVSIVVLIARGRKLSPSHTLIVLFAVYAGLYASRNIPISAILLGMVIGPLLPSGGSRKSFPQRMFAVETGMRGHLWIIAGIVLTFAVVANGGRVGSAQWMSAHFDPQRMPVQAVDYLRSQGASGPILAPDYWGGYLIYRLYPQARVVVDDRHDLYGEQFFRSYLNWLHGEEGWHEFLREHPAGYIVVPRKSALAALLADSYGWSRIYADDVAVVFQNAQ